VFCAISQRPVADEPSNPRFFAKVGTDNFLASNSTNQ